MTARLIYRFAGTDGPVDITGCADVGRHFPAVFPKWPYEQLLSDPAEQEPVLQLRPYKAGFRLSSAQYTLDQELHDPLNAACSIVAELAWARLRAEPDLLCFHGAAIEYNGSLVLIPSQRRAGKSTLSACLVARGRRLFTDDFLPLRLGRDGRFYGIANGSAPRIRLPIPDEFSPEIKSQLMALGGPQNEQYLYLSPHECQLADHGESLPVSAVVLLERKDGLACTLTKTSPVNLLRRMIMQNFSRHMNPARILGMIGHMAKQSHGLSLAYSNAEEASELLDVQLENITQEKVLKPFSPPVSLASAELTQVDQLSPRPKCFDTNQRYHQASSACEIDFEADCFVASSTGRGIHHLDSIARAVWGLLKEPMNAAEITTLFAEAFPDQSRNVLRLDMSKTLRFLRDQHLIEPVDIQ